MRIRGQAGNPVQRLGEAHSISPPVAIICSQIDCSCRLFRTSRLSLARSSQASRTKPLPVQDARGGPGGQTLCQAGAMELQSQGARGAFAGRNHNAALAQTCVHLFLPATPHASFIRCPAAARQWCSLLHLVRRTAPAGEASETPEARGGSAVH